MAGYIFYVFSKINTMFYKFLHIFINDILLVFIRRRNIELKEKTVEELREKVTESKNEGLRAMLDIFDYFLPIIR